MADTITIPSPSVFLAADSPTTLSHSSPKPAPKPKQPRKRSSVANAKTVEVKEEDKDATPSKRKQSKSRNGCVTCKAKRLKCDETKPTCKQCARRSVTCGGYKKDYKWRPFEEASFAPGKPPTFRVPKKDPPRQQVDTSDYGAKRSGKKPALSESRPPSSGQSHGSSPEDDGSMGTVTGGVCEGQAGRSPPRPSSVKVTPGIHQFEASSSPFSISPGFAHHDNIPPGLLSPSLPTRVSAGQTPSMIADDMLVSPSEDSLELPTDVNLSTSGFELHLPAFGPHLPETVDPALLAQDEDDVEEIARSSFQDDEPEHWAVQVPAFYSSGLAAEIIEPGMSFLPPLRGLQLSLDSPEMLTLRFDRQTCGILSVKDGPTENPWRTMVWPLARDSPALYHAIASMTSFHLSRDQPQLRVQGIQHMRSSIQALASGIPQMKYDTAIAATLALAFAESWDTHTSTGINHIKGAKILVGQALDWHRHHPFSEERLARMRFLCNAWVYMDVIARLTSVDVDESNDFDVVYNKFSSFDDTNYLDPLMGAASTLFPLIGRVANLVRRVRRSNSNSPAIISHGMELKRKLEAWQAPQIVEMPEDPTSHLEDSLQTAEAYRWATLLYLHQAVPELPSETSAELAKRVLIFLATVPLGSRAVIVHIYPLLAAGCEALDEEDRQWVRERWASMSARMKIGVIDRCADVTQEVWNRRDEFELESRPRQPPIRRGLSFDDQLAESRGFDPDLSGLFGQRLRRSTFDMPSAFSTNQTRRSSRDPASGRIVQEFTVRGRLHWLGVMKDWNWEVLLG